MLLKKKFIFNTLNRNFKYKKIKNKKESAQSARKKLKIKTKKITEM